MRTIAKMKSKFEKELDKVAGKAAEQPETLEMCLKMFSAKAPESLVGLKRHYKGSLRIAGTFTVRELYDMGPDIAEHIRTEHGGGRFCFEFYNEDKKILATYHIDIDGPIKQYGTKAEGNGDAAKTASKSFQQEIIAMLQAQNTAMLGMLTQGGDASKFEEFAMQFMSNSMDNRLTREEHSLDTASGILSLVNQARPEIPPEDSNVALIQAVGSALGGFMNYKAAQSSSPLSALTGGQDTPVSKSLPPGLGSLAGIAPENIMKVLQSLSPEQLAQLGTKPLTLDTTSNAVELPAPGEQQPVEAGSSEVQLPSISEMPPEHITFEAKIQQFRSDAKNGAEPEILADELLALIEASRLLTPDNPHPLLRELTREDDLKKLSIAMMAFFQKIPELADPELQQQVGMALYTILAGDETTEDQAPQNEAGENDELLAPTTGVQPGRDGTDNAAENDATEQGEHGRDDESEPGGNDGEGLDKPRSIPNIEDAQSKVA